MSNKKPFEIITTKDGSPTVSVSGGEPMHYLAGALSESIYNYGPTISWALNRPEACIHSVGLGVGYNEILCYAIAASQDLPPPSVISFELETFWVEAFKNWLLKNDETLSIYSQILRAVSANYNVGTDSLKSSMAEAFDKRRLLFVGPLGRPLPDVPRANGVLYDAYSSQTDPQLWTEDFLVHYLEKLTAPNVQFSTYAATGDLKRALISQGFKVDLRPGFGKKRNSTMALRD